MEINKAQVRKTLLPRREPYWRHLEGTGHIGYRKMPSGVETWQARWRGDDGKPLQKSLGRVTGRSDYLTACKAARDWFAQCEQGIPQSVTVEGACKAYVENLEVLKPNAAIDPDQRFRKLIYNNSFGRKRLDRLRVADVQQWRNSLIADGRRKKQSANRLLSMFKAAMNYARRSQLVATDAAWISVKPFPNPDGRRDIYLTSRQIKDLLGASPNDLAILLRGYLYTGCRPGELPKARVKDLDVLQGVLTLSTNKGRDGKARRRQVPLSPDALTFFKRQTKYKLPEAWLLTQANGEPWAKQNWVRGIQEIRSKVGSLPVELCAYNLRATTISNWLANGVNLEIVAKVTGTSIGMIEHNYYQFIPTDVAHKLTLDFM